MDQGEHQDIKATNPKYSTWNKVIIKTSRQQILNIPTSLIISLLLLSKVKATINISFSPEYFCRSKIIIIPFHKSSTFFLPLDLLWCSDLVFFGLVTVSWSAACLYLKYKSNQIKYFIIQIRIPPGTKSLVRL